MNTQETGIFDIYSKIKTNISKVIVGKSDVIDLMIISLFCKGHMLLEDVPGTGKTMLIKALAATVDCSSKRIQFTPDLLPSDITGINYFNIKKSEFEFVPGPVFSNILLADEINRATPKTQSGLLECMEEHQTSIDGKTYVLEEPFMVVATQNPVENAGVYPLPEAQLDRFLIKTSMKYPSHDESIGIIERFGSENPLSTLAPAVSKEDVLEAQNGLVNIFIHRDLIDYAVSICEKTRNTENVLLGVSPRGSLSLIRAAKGFAAIDGRNFVKPDDIKKAAVPVLAHRLMLSSSARIKKDAASNIIENILDGISVPTEKALGGWSGK